MGRRPCQLTLKPYMGVKYGHPAVTGCPKSLFKQYQVAYFAQNLRLRSSKTA